MTPETRIAPGIKTGYKAGYGKAIALSRQHLGTLRGWNFSTPWSGGDLEEEPDERPLD